MKFTLNNETLLVEIDTDGGYINRLLFEGQPVFYEKQQLDYDGKMKYRGGSHLCYPQFSSGVNRGLGQHGFARDLEWVVTDITYRQVTMQLTRVEGMYKDVTVNMKHQIKDDMLLTSLSVCNDSDGLIDIAPAFHPYFLVSKEDILKIDGQEIDIDADIYPKTVYQKDIKKIEINDLIINVEQKKMPVFALWTDRKDDYFCIEPTYNSDAFKREEGYITLEPNKCVDFKFSLEFSRKK